MILNKNIYPYLPHPDKDGVPADADQIKTWILNHYKMFVAVSATVAEVEFFKSGLTEWCLKLNPSHDRDRTVNTRTLRYQSATIRVVQQSPVYEIQFEEPYEKYKFEVGPTYTKYLTLGLVGKDWVDAEIRVHEGHRVTTDTPFILLECMSKLAQSAKSPAEIPVTRKSSWGYEVANPTGVPFYRGSASPSTTAQAEWWQKLLAVYDTHHIPYMVTDHAMEVFS